MELRAQEGSLVAEGDVLAVPQTSSVGPSAAPSVEQKMKQSLGKNTELSPDRRSIRAKTYGRLHIEGTKISVVPPVSIADDGMTASMDVCATSFSGLPVTSDMVRRSLAAAGVKHGIDETAIEDALRVARASGASPSLVELAQGTRAVAGNAGGYELAFEGGPSPGEATDKSKARPHVPVLVREGEMLSHKMLRAAPQPGRNVKGEAIRPPSLQQTKPAQWRCGDNVALTDDQQGHVCTAPVCGYAEVENGVLKVTSPISVTDGGLHAHLTVYAPQGDDPAITEDDVHRVLERLGIVYGIDAQAIASAVELVGTRRQSHARVLVARGKPPIAGDHARLRLLLDLERKAGREGEDGRIDFRECSSFVSVAVGQPICEAMPATAGTPGLDVFGREMPATRGRDAAFQPGKGAAWSGEGRRIVATAEGIVVVAGHAVDVCQVVNVRGDVDFSSGSIRAASSSVRVGGTVRAGFAVECMSLFVQEAVEDCEIVVRGELEVRGGILHAQHGRVVAGSVRTGFAQNARIEARESITIRESAVGCSLLARTIACGGRGRGRLVGGVLKAYECIETWDLGMETEVPTVVSIVPDAEEFRVLDAQIDKLQDTIARLTALVGDDPEATGPRSLIPRRSEAVSWSRERDEARKSLANLQARQRGHLEAARMQLRGEVVVRGTAHVGVVVNVFGVKLRVPATRRACRFYLTETMDEVAIGLL